MFTHTHTHIIAPFCDYIIAPADITIAIRLILQV